MEHNSLWSRILKLCEDDGMIVVDGVKLNTNEVTGSMINKASEVTNTKGEIIKSRTSEGVFEQYAREKSEAENKKRESVGKMLLPDIPLADWEVELLANAEEVDPTRWTADVNPEKLESVVTNYMTQASNKESAQQVTDFAYSQTLDFVLTGNLSIEQLMRLMWAATDNLAKRHKIVDFDVSKSSIDVVDNRENEYMLKDIGSSPEHEGKTAPFYSEYHD